MNKDEHYRIGKGVLLATVQYLRQRPHEEVDALIRAIQEETVGPLRGSAAKPKRFRAAPTTAMARRQPAVRSGTPGAQ